jgi:aminopeptidase
MVDPRIKKMAQILVDHSTRIKKNENVTISGSTEAKDLLKEIYRLALKKGAYPFMKVNLPGSSYI